MQEELTQSEVRTLLQGGHVGKRPAPFVGELEIELPYPPSAVWPNSRSHWATKARAVKFQREDAAVAAKISLRTYAPPKWDRVTIEATFYKPGARSKTSDADNSIAALKASVDGLEDAGVISNDRGVTWLPPIQLIGKEAEGERKVVLKITRMD